MKRYSKRLGADASGWEYEIKITSLLAIRYALRKDCKDIWLGSNLDEVGNFDDIVLFKESLDGTVTAYLMQLKHQYEPEKLTRKEFTSNSKSNRKDFCLTKYYDEYKKLNDKISNPEPDESLIIKDLRNAQKRVFVLYTNRGVKPSIDILEEHFDDGLRTLNTSVKNNVYKFKNLSIYGNFLDSLFVFTDQVHLSETERLMSNEIKGVLGTDFLNNIDLSTFVERFSTFIVSWAKDRRICEPLTKDDILNQITYLFLDYYKINLLKEPYLTYECPNKLIWNQLVSQKVLTVVDFSGEVVEFLKSYVGSELVEYTNDAIKSWSDIVKTAQKLLLGRNIKVIGVTNTVTLLDCYKYLWFANKVPLLLQVETVGEYRNIIRILKLSGYSKRTIIVAKTNIEIVVKPEKNNFLRLSNLEAEPLSYVLKMPVRLQGRGPTPLINLIDESMFHLMKTQDIISILSGTYTVGDYYKELPDFFIDRYIPKVFIDHEILKTPDGDCSPEFPNFFINRHLPKGLINHDILKRNVFVIEGEFSFFTPNSNILIVRSREEALARISDLRKDNKVIHWLKYDEHLEWLQSFGGTEVLAKYCYELSNCRRTISDTYSNVNILSGSPGMGKSVFLNYIARVTPTDKWVLNLNLSEIEDKSFDEVIESVWNKYTCNKQLALKVFEKMRSKRDVIILLDGFDEVQGSRQRSVIQFASELVDQGFVIWITTRPSMKASLETVFQTMAVTLTPFTMDDQRRFLNNYFGRISSEPHQELIIQDFVRELLTVAQKNLYDWSQQFTEIPLQTKLLAEVFYNDCKQSVVSGTISFDHNFDLLFLYEKFIKMKLAIMTEKFGRTAMDMQMLFEHQHKICAVAYLYPRSVLPLGLRDEIDKFCSNNELQNQFMQRDGIFVMESYYTRFVHKSFAEFLTAQWFSENTTNDYVLQLRYSSGSTFIFNIFDRILSKKNSLHTAIINLKTTDAINLIRAKPDQVNAVDVCGRNVVHLIALYGAKHQKKVRYEKVLDPLLKVLESIPNVDSLSQVQDKSLHTPLDHAVKSWSLAVADYLSQHNSSLNVDIEETYDYFIHCANLGYSSLFRLLVRHFYTYDVLCNCNMAEDNVASILASKDEYCDKAKILCFDKEFCEQPLKELFKYKYTGQIADVPEFYFDLRFASVFGNQDNIQYLIEKGADVNKKDIHNNTSLHYACYYGKEENAKVLLENGAQTNTVNALSNSPLHYAVRGYPAERLTCYYRGKPRIFHSRNRKSLVELVIKYGADINLQNHALDTALHYAAKTNDCEVILFLLNHGADVDIINYQTESPLFLAVESDCLDIIDILLENGADVNLRSHYGQAVLNIAADRGYANLVQSFIDHGADINNSDIGKHSVLHYALRRQHFVIAKTLVENGADYNLPNKDGYTALHLVAAADTDLLPLMLKTVDVNSRTRNGDTALHLALSERKTENIVALLDHGAEVNVANDDGNTPLHVAADFCDTKTIEMILQKLPECSKRNKDGDNPLDILLKREDLTSAYLLIPHCDINQSNEKEPLLHFAVRKSSIELVNFLIDNNAEVNIRNNNGATALHVSVTKPFYYSNHDINTCQIIVQLLLEAGADVNAKDILGNTALHYLTNLDRVLTIEGDDIRTRLIKILSI